MMIKVQNQINEQAVIDNIKQLAAKVLPKGSTVYLYGSRARGDSHEDSDWDLLVLLDKEKLEYGDFDKYSYPFVLMGWDYGQDIRPHAYTKNEWFNGPHAMFYYNVEEDKEVLYES
ncbi:MAG: nucleotidyltransferase domain-containing protein [Prevotella sp.]|nr:nucleotidyltransferase domain-containing protein [Prevotella sp.]